MASTDLLDGASPEERAFFEANYTTVPLLTLYQRLRVAEWNANYRKERIDQLTTTVQKLKGQVHPPDRSVPPQGWTLPPGAADLLDCAQERAWFTRTSWSERSNGDPLVTVQLAHQADDGRLWAFDLSWVASGTGTSMSRLGRGIARMPGRVAWRDAPPLKRIREVIEANPAQ